MGGQLGRTGSPLAEPIDRASADVTAEPVDGVTAEDGRRRRTWRELAVDAAVVFGLAGLAVTQPVLDLLGQNPTFFVAGGYGRRQIVAFALVVAAVPALVVWLVAALAVLVHRRAGAVLHAVGVAIFGGLFGLVLGRSLGIDGAVPLFGFGAVVGVGVAAAERRWRPVRQFLGLLVVGNVAFVVLFLVASPTTALLRGASYADVGHVQVPPLEGPVTVLMLDELPLSSIVRPDGTINEVRYPNLAALAEENTWFRNAAAESAFTAYSVPSILTGLLDDPDDHPILRDHPRNYFTLFGQSYPVNRYERISDLCPPEACGRPPAQPLAQALSDASLVYQHSVLPTAWRDSLPAIDQSWGQFADDAPAPDPVASTEERGRNDRLRDVSEEDKSKAGQLNALVRQARLIDGNPSINFIHVLSPHHPYVLAPWGTSIDTWNPKDMPEPGEPGHDRMFADRYALQAMQTGVLDQALGDVIEHLKEVGAWDIGTFVLTSDHGTTTSAPGNGRALSDETQDDLLRIPLFIKAPGQTAGEVRDDPASTIDVLPSIIDLFGIETDWSFDGHSLFDGSEPTADRLITSDLDDLYAHVAWQQERFPHGENWVAMAAIGEHGDLVGTEVSEHALGEPSALSWMLKDRESLADPSRTHGMVPVLMRGTVDHSTVEPPDLVVALDGTIAGTVGGYRPDGSAWKFSGILGPPGARGQGESVTAYEVERQHDGAIVLHAVGDG